MKTFQIPMTEAEIDLVLKMMDKVPSQGIETQRLVVGLSDKIVSIVRSQNGSNTSVSAPVTAES